VHLGKQVNHNHFWLFKLAFGRFSGCRMNALECPDQGALTASTRQKAVLAPLVPSLRINQQHKTRRARLIRPDQFGFGLAMSAGVKRR
jgi:hypothetical protein